MWPLFWLFSEQIIFDFSSGELFIYIFLDLIGSFLADFVVFFSSDNIMVVPLMNRHTYVSLCISFLLLIFTNIIFFGDGIYTRVFSSVVDMRMRDPDYLFL